MEGRVSEALVTERLTLRRPTPADVDLIYCLHSDRRACWHNPADMLSTPAEAEALYQAWDRHWQAHGFGYWVAHVEGERVGVCGVKVMTLRGHDVLNLLYRLGPSMWGRGLATEAATAVVRWADARRPDDSVIARIRPANVASQRVAEKAGLHRGHNSYFDLECFKTVSGGDYVFDKASNSHHFVRQTGGVSC